VTRNRETSCKLVDEATLISDYDCLEHSDGDLGLSLLINGYYAFSEEYVHVDLAFGVYVGVEDMAAFPGLK
jgi:hypothetical protein